MKSLLVIGSAFMVTFFMTSETVRADDPIDHLKNTILEGSLGKRSVDEIFTTYVKATNPSHRQELVLTMALRKDEFLPHILEKLRAGSEGEKIRIIKLVESTLWNETVPIFINILKNPSESEIVRTGAAYILGKLGDPRAAPALRDALESAISTDEKRAALIGLAFLSDRDSVNVLLPFLMDRDKLVAIYAAMALGELGYREGLKAAMDGTHDEDWKVRKEAIYALGSIGGKEAIERLEDLSETENLAGLKAEAKVALHRIKIKDLSTQETLSYLEKRLEDGNRETRMWAIKKLSKESGKEGLLVLKRKAQGKSEIGRLTAFYYLLGTQGKDKEEK
jgi:hypothetical protein